MNVRRILYPAVAAIGIGALGTYAYHAQRQQPGPTEQRASAAPADKPAAKQAKSSVAVDVATVEVVKLVEDVNAVGSIRSNEGVMLRPEIAGRITRLNFSDGRPVRKGQVLVAFDATVNEAEVRQAKAELGIAKANFDRNADLAKQKFISDRARDESLANVQVLEAKLALAEARLSKLEIRAPFAGVVGIRRVSIGDYVKDGADLVNLEDISSVKVDFRLPERYMDMVQAGQSLEVMVDALPGKPFGARVDAIDPQVDSSGRSALLRGRIDNPEGKLKPGMFARVRLILSERDQALMIPEEAIVPQGIRITVWKVVDGKAVKTDVKTGLRRAAKVEITSGLGAGDQVVTAGQVRLSTDGTPVRIVHGAAARGMQEAKPNDAPATLAANS
jgi:membrane fusion protein (multidrug efflux system)